MTTVSTQQQSSTEQFNQNQPSAVELAVFNLSSVTHLADHQIIAHQVQKYLQVCGNTSLQQLQSAASVVTIANIFALTGSVLDLLLFATEQKKADAGIQQAALLSMNLIGLCAEPNHEAHARIALRPMLGLMAQCLYPVDGKIKNSDIRRLELHLNAMIAGDLEQFLKETQAKLATLLSEASTLGITILKSFAASAPTTVPIVALSAGATAEKRDPKENFLNWATPLIDLIAAPAQADMSSKLTPQANSRLQTEVTQALTVLATTIQQQANAGQKYTLAWLLQETLKALKSQANKANASVPANQTGEHEQHLQGDILEFVTLQADALKAPPCEGADSQSGRSISYSIGAERVNHADFYLPKVDFAFSRQYNSQMNEFDQSMMGARWMMPFSNLIIQNKNGYLFIDGKGRKHQLPASILNEAYQVPYEGFMIQPLQNSDLMLNFGGDWNFQFHSFNAGKHYHLIQQFNGQTNEKVVLSYLLFEQFAYLQAVDFKLKRGKNSLKFAFNDQAKIIAAFVDEQPEPLARYEYDLQGNLVQAIDQNGHTRRYEYNNAHQLTRYTDRTGRGQNVRYESIEPKAKAIAEWADDGSFKTRLEWHPRLRQVAVYDAYDVPTYYYFDLDGFTYRTRLADGRESWLSRDSQKRITRQIDFAGFETEQVYNDQDQLIKIIQPNGGIIRFAYDDQGNLTETKDPEGNIWKKEYDTKGNVIKEINPLGHITQYKYNNDNQIIEVIDAKGGSKKLQYNDLGQMIAYTDCSGKSSAWQYDDLGVIQSQEFENKQKIRYIYSTQGQDQGQLQAVIYPDGLKEQFEYDEEGRLLQHTDTKGLNTEYQYNAVGLLEKRIDANQHQIGYQWDKQGRIEKLINQNYAEYRFDYNRYGQLIREQAFDGEEKHFSYGDNGQLLQIRQPNILTKFAYHTGGQIASKTYTHLQTQHSQTEVFEYNLNNQLSKVSNSESQIDFYRNQLGQLVREHQHYKLAHLTPLTAVLRYEYDELGNLTQTIRPDGQVQSNLSYGSGHTYAVAFNQHDLVAFKRDDLHRETARMLANGLIQTKNYNNVGLLVSQLIHPEQQTFDRVQLQAERHYQYDKNYLLTQVHDSRLGKLHYQYDSIGRLIKTQTPHKAESFSFDPAGNLIDSSATQESYVKNNLIKSYQGKQYKYDAQGNMIEISQADKTLKLTWDNLNRLIQSNHNGQITDYGYDVFGRRLFKKNHQENSLTLFGWDGDLMIWESMKSNKVQESYTKHYVYEPNSFVPLLQTGYTDFIQLIKTPNYEQFKTEAYSIKKDPVWRTDTRKNKAELEYVTFYHCDQVGTPQTLSNELGECVWEIKQDTWGIALEIKASDNLLEQTNLRFQGQYYDDETGLHYNRYRYYEPSSARYLSKDPIGLFGGLNNSSYVSDPNQWVDSMGLMAEDKKFPDVKKLREDNIEFQQKTYEKIKSESVYGEINSNVEKIKKTHKNVVERQASQFSSRSIQQSKKIEYSWGEEDPRRRGCQCKVYDYLACSGSLLGQNVTLVKNLWGNEQEGWYISGSKSALITQTKTPPKSIKDMVGASCAAGIIHNLDKVEVKRYGMKRITHEFLNGASASVGAVFGPGIGIGANYVVPMVDKKSMVYGAKSAEVVVGTVGYNIDVGITKKLSRENYGD